MDTRRIWLAWIGGLVGGLCLAVGPVCVAQAQVVIQERVEVQPSAAEKQAGVQALEGSICERPEYLNLSSSDKDVCLETFDFMRGAFSSKILLPNSTDTVFISVDTLATRYHYTPSGWIAGVEIQDIAVDQILFYTLPNQGEADYGHYLYNGMVSDVIEGLSPEEGRSGQVGFVVDGISPYPVTGDLREPDWAYTEAAIQYSIAYASPLMPDGESRTVQCAQCTGNDPSWYRALPIYVAPMNLRLIPGTRLIFPADTVRLSVELDVNDWSGELEIPEATLLRFELEGESQQHGRLEAPGQSGVSVEATYADVRDGEVYFLANEAFDASLVEARKKVNITLTTVEAIGTEPTTAEVEIRARFDVVVEDTLLVHKGWTSLPTLISDAVQALPAPDSSTAGMWLRSYSPALYEFLGLCPGSGKQMADIPSLAEPLVQIAPFLVAG